MLASASRYSRPIHYNSWLHTVLSLYDLLLVPSPPRRRLPEPRSSGGMSNRGADCLHRLCCKFCNRLEFVPERRQQATKLFRDFVCVDCVVLTRQLRVDALRPDCTCIVRVSVTRRRPCSAYTGMYSHRSTNTRPASEPFISDTDSQPA